MDSSRKINGKDNGRNSYDGNSNSGNDGEKIGKPKASTNSIKAAALRPSMSRSSVPSPYSKTWELLEMDNHDYDRDSEADLKGGFNSGFKNALSFQGNGDRNHRSVDSLKQAPVNNSLLSRSATMSSSSPPAFGRNLTPPSATNATSLNSVASSKGSSIYGTKNTRGSLEDDDPSDSAANIIDHLTISSSLASAHSRRIISTSGGMVQSMGVRDDGAAQSLSSTQKVSNFSRGQPQTYTSDERHYMQQQQRQTHFSSQSPLSTPVSSSSAQMQGESDMRKAPPKNDEDYNYSDELEEKDDSAFDTKDRDFSVSLATESDASLDQDDFIAIAKEHTTALLLSASMSSVIPSNDEATDINVDYIRNLIDCCKNYQTMLQGKLSEFFQENTDATDHHMELFGLSDDICSAIEAGEKALKREEEKTQKTKVAEGPTIELLEANRDVFSLICMLRAANEKRMLAALALMRFAKDDQALRNEIISSGGIHSFLTLFQQTRGITRELKVVASLAVAHILPSYVASSQTTSAIGLKLVECLHFLAKSNPVSPNGVVITMEEMCQAASLGVNVLWINSIQPLIALKKVKDECSSSPPSLRPGKSVRYGRLRSRTG